MPEKILLIDSVKYEPWTPPSEDEFERIVKERAQEIFSEQSIYLDRKQKLKSLAGIGSIPDGYAIVFGDSFQWHIVEVELSSHPLYNHIVSQVGRFITGINNPSTRKMIIDALYHELILDKLFLNILDKTTYVYQTGEIYKFISDLVSDTPVITIVVEKDTPEVREALGSLGHSKKNIVEFRTFVREGVGLAVHAHLFEPLVKEKSPTPPSASQPLVLRDGVPVTHLPLGNDSKSIEVMLSRGVTWKRYHLIYFGTRNRLFFPGYKIPFQIETDKGNITTWVASTTKGGKRGGTEKVGDVEAGMYIQKNMKPWFDVHPELKAGDKVHISVIEPMKKYRLEIVR